jgi:hypothetical protein
MNAPEDQTTSRSDSPDPAEQGREVRVAASRLRALVRHTEPGGCRLVSRGSDCDCLLCAIDLLEGLASSSQQKEKEGTR